ncbi:MAG TPA: hypothetical protein VF881_06735 [Polyangiaceae bacterium]
MVRAITQLGATERSRPTIAAGVAIASVLISACLPRVPPPQPPRDEPTAERAYDFRSKTRVGGEILTIDDVRANDAAFGGLHVMMPAEYGVISVDLGPKAFFDSNAIALKVGDKLDITGIPATYHGNPTLLATAINRGDQALKLPERAPEQPDGAAVIR